MATQIDPTSTVTCDRSDHSHRSLVAARNCATRASRKADRIAS